MFMTTKINLIRQVSPKGSIFLSAWLVRKGISTKEQTDYVRSGWIERLSHGIYKFVGDTPTLYSSLASYCNQSNIKYHVGASSALDIMGFSHYVAMGKPQCYIFSSHNHKLPKWFFNNEWDMTMHHFTSDIFGDIGIVKRNIGDFSLPISSPERAFMECLHLAPEYFSLMDIYYVMEMLNTLRPNLVDKLLHNCTSVKVKRLFLYMAEKANHQWYSDLHLNGVDFGSGPRSFANGGVMNAKYKIVIPKELATYE
jgi:hypothetical protein